MTTENSSELFETIMDALARGSAETFTLDDCDMKYNFLEQFDSLTPYLTEKFLEELLDNGEITRPVFFVGLAIGEAWRKIENIHDLPANELRENRAVRQVSLLCDWCIREIATSDVC